MAELKKRGKYFGDHDNGRREGQMVDGEGGRTNKLQNSKDGNNKNLIGQFFFVAALFMSINFNFYDILFLKIKRNIQLTYIIKNISEYWHSTLF